MTETTLNKTETNGTDFDIDAALNDKAFLAFLAKREGGDQLVYEHNVAEIQKLREAFEIKKTASKELIGLYKREMQAEIGLAISDKDLEAIDGALEKIALESPEKLAEIQKHLELNRTLPGEIASAQQEILSLCGTDSKDQYREKMEAISQGFDYEKIAAIRLETETYVKEWEQLQRRATDIQALEGQMTKPKDLIELIRVGVRRRQLRKAEVALFEQAFLNQQMDFTRLSYDQKKKLFLSDIVEKHAQAVKAFAALQGTDTLTNLEDKLTGIALEGKRAMDALFGDYISKEIIAEGAKNALIRKDAELVKDRSLAGLKKDSDVVAGARAASEKSNLGLEYMSAEKASGAFEALDREVEETIGKEVEKNIGKISLREDGQLARMEKVIDGILAHGPIGNRSEEDMRGVVTLALLNIRDTLGDDKVAQKIIINRLMRKYGTN